jgi:hypothetical protein
MIQCQSKFQGPSHKEKQTYIQEANKNTRKQECKQFLLSKHCFCLWWSYFLHHNCSQLQHFQCMKTNAGSLPWSKTQTKSKFLSLPFCQRETWSPCWTWSRFCECVSVEYDEKHMLQQAWLKGIFAGKFLCFSSYFHISMLKKTISALNSYWLFLGYLCGNLTVSFSICIGEIPFLFLCLSLFLCIFLELTIVFNPCSFVS